MNVAPIRYDEHVGRIEARAVIADAWVDSGEGSDEDAKGCESVKDLL